MCSPGRTSRHFSVAVSPPRTRPSAAQASRDADSRHRARPLVAKKFLQRVDTGQAQLFVLIVLGAARRWCGCQSPENEWAGRSNGGGPGLSPASLIACPSSA